MSGELPAEEGGSAQRPGVDRKRRIYPARAGQHAAVHDIEAVQSMHLALRIDHGCAGIVSGDQGAADVSGARKTDSLRECDHPTAQQGAAKLLDLAEMLTEGRPQAGLVEVQRRTTGARRVVGACADDAIAAVRAILGLQKKAIGAAADEA